ncbi:MAG: Anaerobic sulfite reductase subunit C [Actinobacteria bacterium]|nr:Anaerobic sulfite reductase subunit C [Actinomycetota bacterium]
MADRTGPTLDLDILKAGGLIKQRQPDLFSVRVRALAGNLTAGQLAKLGEISTKYGKGYVHVTMRQGVEIPFVHLDNLETVAEELDEVGLKLGACGPRFRVITACQGASICNHGLGDTESLAKKIDERYYGRSGLPHKFKVGIAGCPNACIKPQENDLGFMGVAQPILDESNGAECISCGICEDVCPVKAIQLVDGKPQIDLTRCINDGKCINSCPTGSLRPEREGWTVFVGGKFGKHPQLGWVFDKFVSEEEAVELVEKILKAYCHLAHKRERLGELINRIGLEKFREAVQSEQV